jgi:hypothetical protein
VSGEATQQPGLPHVVGLVKNQAGKKRGHRLLVAAEGALGNHSCHRRFIQAVEAREDHLLGAIETGEDLFDRHNSRRLGQRLRASSVWLRLLVAEGVFDPEELQDAFPARQDVTENPVERIATRLW